MSIPLTEGIIGIITAGRNAKTVYNDDTFFTVDDNIGAVRSDNNWLSAWALKADDSTC